MWFKKWRESKDCKNRKNWRTQKRLVDMGITAGEIIKLERNAPLGDPQEYIIKSTGIAIRKEDAKNIEVEKIEG